MTPRQFSRQFRVDDRLARGTYFRSSGLEVNTSDRVGVVLLSLGGPRNRSEVESFVYSRWLDPILFGRGPRAGRHVVVSAAARLAAPYFWKPYEEIGGECPSVRLTREQAVALQKGLNRRSADFQGATFKTYVAARYGSPSVESTYRRLLEDDVTAVLLVPTYPQYSIATTGTSMAYWSAIASRSVPTSAVVEYAAHPLYVQAVSERIDQALQRFPKRFRPQVEIIFCAEHEQAHGRLSTKDSFCDLAQTTVNRIAEIRNRREGYDVTCFSTRSAMGRADRRHIRSVLTSVASRKAEAVLIVPLGLSTDHVWTANGLDIQLRQTAADLGIRSFEVASGLNCHPLFISALEDVVATQLTVGSGVQEAESSQGGERLSAPARGGPRMTGCPTCRGPVRAREWDSAPRRGAALQ